MEEEKTQQEQGVYKNNLSKNVYSMLKNKRWFVIVVVVFVFFMIVFFITMAMNKSTINTNTQTGNNNTIIPTKVPSEPSPTLTIELKQAVEEAKRSSLEYDTAQSQKGKDFPWLRKLPIVQEKYFVYYDMDKDVFVGKLYITDKDDVELIKNNALQTLKFGADVPVEDFMFEWEEYKL